eukprot:2904359-Rhodomonas_salina.1
MGHCDLDGGSSLYGLGPAITSRRSGSSRGCSNLDGSSSLDGFGAETARHVWLSRSGLTVGCCDLEG